MDSDPINNNNTVLRCSFCCKRQHEVRTLFADPGVYICDECVTLCSEILEGKVSRAAPLDVTCDASITSRDLKSGPIITINDTVLIYVEQNQIFYARVDTISFSTQTDCNVTLLIYKTRSASQQWLLDHSCLREKEVLLNGKNVQLKKVTTAGDPADIESPWHQLLKRGYGYYHRHNLGSATTLFAFLIAISDLVQDEYLLPNAYLGLEASARV